jgi:hypothetical protein
MYRHILNFICLNIMNSKEAKKKESEKDSVFKKFNLLHVVIVNKNYRKRSINTLKQ